MSEVALMARVGQPTRVELDTEAIRAYAAAARATDPAYRGERPVVPPTFLPAGGAGERRETDHRFFGVPPRAGDRLTAVATGADGSLTRYFDRTGGLVAESWASPDLVAGEPAPPDADPAALLATYATGWLGAENIRRFRTRLAGPRTAGGALVCSGYVTQRYVQDGEPRVDVTLTAVDADGAVVVRAWASFARP
ncbi:hypothetical protein ACWEVD_28190 [Nocardia thailandica]|uniref:hypothetical protein n=1 Tax=Nocardia thailandica TaxID=257275 RepID=UPI000304EBC3|nr:hypothetical protein [Nocardia thailandica]